MFFHYQISAVYTRMTYVILIQGIFDDLAILNTYKIVSHLLAISHALSLPLYRKISGFLSRMAPAKSATTFPSKTQASILA